MVNATGNSNTASNNDIHLQGFFSPNVIGEQKKSIFSKQTPSKDGQVILGNQFGTITTIQAKVFSDNNSKAEAKLLATHEFVPIKLANHSKTTYLKVDQLAQTLGVSKQTIINSSRSGSLPKLLRDGILFEKAAEIPGTRLDPKVTDQIKEQWSKSGASWTEQAKLRQLNSEAGLKISRKITGLSHSLTAIQDKATKQMHLYVHTHSGEKKGDNILGQGMEKRFKELVPLDPEVGKTVVGMWMYGGMASAKECVKQVRFHHMFQGMGTPIVHSFVDYKKSLDNEFSPRRVGIVAKGYTEKFEDVTEGKTNLSQKLLVKGTLQAVTGWTRMVSMGYCHFDIKPDNIFFNQVQNAKGESDIDAVLGDFGAVYTYASKEAIKELPASQGTKQYLPPESKDYGAIADGSLKVQSKYKMRPEEFIVARDTYAWGVTMYEQMNKVTLWKEDPKEMATFNEFISKEPDDKESIDHLTWSLLRPNPKDRPSPNEFLNRLKTINDNTI